MKAKTTKASQSNKPATPASGLVITLGEIYSLQGQFKKLKGLIVSPEIAFSLRKYIADHFDSTIKLIEEQRADYVAQYKTTAEGEPVAVEQSKDPQKFAAFVQCLETYFSQTVPVQVCNIKMSEINASLVMAYRQHGQMIDTQMLIDLEKFFSAD